MTRVLMLNAAAATDLGGGVVGLPCTAHGLGVNSPFNLQGTVAYDGTYLVDAASSADVIAVSAAYLAETFSGAELVIPLPQDVWKPVTLLSLNVRA